MDAKLKAFQRLLDTMEDLREQCPWDRKQTMESLRPNTIEETYELADAILEKDPGQIKEELGDLMLHVVFYSRIGREDGNFDIADVCNAIVDKLVKRHPHIYGDVEANSEAEVKNNWEQLKLNEKKDKGALDGIPESLPSLIKAFRLQEKASGVGFDWDNGSQVWDKLEEELAEFKEYAGKENDAENLEAEFGDLLFSIINYARFLNIDPENALEKTNIKFSKRFNYLQDQVKKQGKDLKSMTIGELESYWQEAKKALSE